MKENISVSVCIGLKSTRLNKFAWSPREKGGRRGHGLWRGLQPFLLERLEAVTPWRTQPQCYLLIVHLNQYILELLLRMNDLDPTMVIFQGTLAFSIDREGCEHVCEVHTVTPTVKRRLLSAL
jgi:hypothetical protein